jgi:hypothetical protein
MRLKNSKYSAVGRKLPLEEDARQLLSLDTTRSTPIVGWQICWCLFARRVLYDPKIRQVFFGNKACFPAQPGVDIGSIIGVCAFYNCKLKELQPFQDPRL